MYDTCMIDVRSCAKVIKKKEENRAKVIKKEENLSLKIQVILHSLLY